VARRGPAALGFGAGLWSLAGAVPLPAQDASPAYRPSMLACVTVRQSVSSDVLTVRGDVRRAETVGWSGTAVVDGTADGNGSIAIVMWFDSLAVWREAPEGRLEPSAAGMIGGRYRGTIDSSGVFTRSAAPFIPEAVRSVVRLDRALDDLWAPVPPPSLGPGSRGDAPGSPWRFERLTDTTLATGAAWRFRLTRSDSGAVSVAYADGVTAEGQSVEHEDGRLVWDPRRGPVTWVRHIVTTVTFPRSAVTHDPVRTEVRQERVFRRGESSPDRCQ